MGKNKKENSENGSLVVFEGGVKPDRNENAPQQENAPEVFSPASINTYFENFRYFEKKITSYEDMTNYTNMVMRFLKRGGDSKEVVELQKAFKEFTSRVTSEGYDVARAINTAVNKSGDRNAAGNAGADAEKLSATRKEFNTLSNRLETFMRANPNNPAVEHIIKRTKHIIGDGAPKAGRAEEGKKQADDFSTAPGPNKEERDAFFAQYTEYIKNVVNVSQAKYVVNSNDRSTPEERLVKNLRRVIEYGGRGINDFKGFPIPETDEELKSLGTQEGLNAYFKKIDYYFINNQDKIDYHKLNEATRFVKNDNEYFTDVYFQEEYLKEIGTVIKDKNIDWNTKKVYLRNVCGAGLGHGLPSAYNIEVPYLEEYRKDGKTLKSEDEKLRSVNTWLHRVGNEIAKENRYDRKRKDAVIMTHGMCSAGRGTLDNLPKINKVLEAGKPILENTVAVTAKMNKIYEYLEGLRDVKESKLEAGEERFNPEGLLGALEKASETYLASMEVTNPGMYWSKEEVESIGSVIDVMSTMNPGSKSKLCARMGLRVNIEGKYELGGDIPLLEKSSAQMLEAKNIIKNADPALMKSSPEYRDLREITEKLQDKTAKLMKNREKKGKLTEEEINELLTMAEEASSCADAYTTYKLADLGDKAPNKIEKKRINASAFVSAVADDIKKDVREYTLEKALREGSEAAFDAVEKQVCRRPVPTTEDLGAMVYIRLARRQNQADPDKHPVKLLLDYKNMQSEVDAILGDADFKKVVKEMPKELTGRAAMEHVYIEMLKKTSNKQKEPVRQENNVKHGEPVRQGNNVEQNEPVQKGNNKKHKESEIKKTK